METVKIEVESAETASRMEILVRILWAIATYIVLIFLGLLGQISWFIQLLVILVTGKRNATLTKLVKAWYLYVTRAYAYFMLLTDERSPLMPEI